MCSQNLSRWQGITTQNIDSSGHRFNVERIAALSVTTKMIKVQSFGNWSNELLINNAMSHSISDVTTRSNLSVTIGANIANPIPATTFINYYFSRNERIKNG